MSWTVIHSPVARQVRPDVERLHLSYDVDGGRYGHWYDLEAGKRISARRRQLPPRTRQAIAAARRVQISFWED